MPKTTNYSFQTFNVPGSSLTVTDMNNSGEVVGWYLASAFPTNTNNPQTAFTYVNGALNSHLIPALITTSFDAVNDSGVVAGHALGDVANVFVGTPGPGNTTIGNNNFFDPNQSGAYPYEEDFPKAINNSGVIVGQTDIPLSSTGEPTEIPWQGFIYDGSNFKVYGGPGTTLGKTQFVDINDNGLILGDGGNGYNAYTFNYTTGAVSPITFSAASTATAITGNALNNSGEVVGSYLDKAGREHGFTDIGGKITTVDVNGANSSTDIVSVNDLGVALGSYSKSGTEQMFLYQDGKVATLTIPNAVSVDPVKINNLNDIVGTYTDASGTVHGFFGTPPAASLSGLFATDQTTSGALSMLDSNDMVPSISIQTT